MENSFDFAVKSDGWVMWNHSGWKDGWINLRAIPARGLPGERRKIFALGWNGERFAQGQDIHRLKKYDPDTEYILGCVLAEKLPKPCH